MKVKIEPGRVVRLTPTANSSSRGGTYDLDALKIPAEQQKEIAALKGVSEVKPPAKKSAKSGGDG